LKNKIRELSIIDVNNSIAVVTVTVIDLSTFLSHTRRPDLTLLILRRISRGIEPRCDHVIVQLKCNGVMIVIGLCAKYVMMKSILWIYLKTNTL
jgi:hypothetical protein